MVTAPTDAAQYLETPPRDVDGESALCGRIAPIVATTRLATLLAAALLAACDSAAPVTTDAAVDAPATDDAADVPGPVDVGVDVPPTPYDAGEAPACEGEAVVRPIAAASAGYSDGEVAGLVPYRGGFLALWRESALRGVGGVDGAVAGRDQITLLAVDPNGAPQREPAVVRSTSGTRVDLSTPALTRAGEGALVLFRESTGAPGDADFATRVVSAPVDASGAPGGLMPLLNNFSDPIAAGLGSGVTLALAARVVGVLDGGAVVASPAAFRVRASGELAAPAIDVTAFLPASAESVVLRPSGDAAAVVYKRGSDVYVVRFDVGGLIDSAGPRVSRNLLVPSLDDAAPLAEGTVIVWSEELNGQSVVSTAVLGLDGAVRARRVLESYVGDLAPVTVVPSYGGATALWLRGGLLRGATIRPDGVVGAAFDGPSVPDGAGRVVAVASGRRVTAVAQTGPRGRRGVSFTRFCIPAS
ncbi:MAG: hypothetical protein JWM10_3543 [Myxococcaceae bacterium]|nr:hypothetical protein [Myxococcaceae bacterium]